LALGSNNIVASYTGDMNFLASGASAPATVACTAGCGNGTGQSLAVSFVQGTPTAATGSSANAGTSSVVVSVTPGGGFTGGVELSCSVTGSKSGDVNVPTCSFTPATVTITNAQSVQATLMVTSNPAGTVTASDTQAGGRFMAGGGAMLACVLLFGLPNRRRGMAILRVVLCFTALGAALGGVTGCGGNASQSPAGTVNGASGATTPDVYTVTVRAVDAASGTLTAQNSFTIQVN
jgi:hypothetical protein